MFKRHLINYPPSFEKVGRKGLSSSLIFKISPCQPPYWRFSFKRRDCGACLVACLTKEIQRPAFLLPLCQVCSWPWSRNEILYHRSQKAGGGACWQWCLCRRHISSHLSRSFHQITTRLLTAAGEWFWSKNLAYLCRKYWCSHTVCFCHIYRHRPWASRWPCILRTCDCWGRPSSRRRPTRRPSRSLAVRRRRRSWRKSVWTPQRCDVFGRLSWQVGWDVALAHRGCASALFHSVVSSGGADLALITVSSPRVRARACSPEPFSSLTRSFSLKVSRSLLSVGCF